MRDSPTEIMIITEIMATVHIKDNKEVVVVRMAKREYKRDNEKTVCILKRIRIQNIIKFLLT